MTRAIVLVAPFDEGHHAHAALRRRALERLGWTVSCVNLLQPKGIGGWFRRSGWEKTLSQAVQRRPAVVLALGVPGLDATMVRALKSPETTWINWFPEESNGADLGERAGAFDQVFASGSDLAETLQAALGRPVELLPPACDPSVHRPNPDRTQQYRANVVFAGRATRRRELLLAQLVEFGLALWGPGWRESALRDYCRGEVTNTEEFVRAYAGASVAVNIHHRSDQDDEPRQGCNQRLFEIAGIGVPQVVDARGDLPRWFQLGSEVEMFESAAELRGVVEALIGDSARAEELGAASRRRALSEHTYMHRLRALLSVVPAE